MTAYEVVATVTTTALVIVGIVYTRLTHKLAASAERQIRMQAAGALHRELREVNAFYALLDRVLTLLERVPWIEDPKHLEEFAGVDFWTNVETKDIVRLTVRHCPMLWQQSQQARQQVDWIRKNAVWVQRMIGKPRSPMYPDRFWYYMGNFRPSSMETLKEIQRAVQARRDKLQVRAKEYEDVMW